MFRGFLLSICILIIQFTTPVWADDYQERLNTFIANNKLTSPDSLKIIYRDENTPLLWSSRQFKELVFSIKDTKSHGLRPEDYHFNLLISEKLENWKKDIYATDAYLTLAGHLLAGKVNPVSLEPAWTAKKREYDLVSYLKSALKNGDISKSLNRLAPSQPEYKILQAALARYTNIAHKGNWTKIETNYQLKPNIKSPEVTTLRKRLEENGEVGNKSKDRDLFDGDLLKSVKKVQTNSNIHPDGIVGPATLKILNLSPQDRIDQIRVNLERWRWMPETLGNKHIRVNIADYQLETFEADKKINTHDVIVGRTYRKTPVFSANMSYIVLNPRWEIPQSIATKDILPKIKKTPSLISDLGYEILDNQGNIQSQNSLDLQKYSLNHFPYRMRQKPGPQNALGLVKFMFPNKHNVYLHDTSSRELFTNIQRDFSSGCIRVKNPIDLVEWVLKGDNSWKRSNIDNSIASGNETFVSLKNKIAVHLLYFTVVPDKNDNNVRFLNDIYSRDAKVLVALNKDTSN